MSQRFEGHNLEEALNSAAAALGVERFQITHRILVEKRGFLGGMKRVVIEADVDDSATELAAPPLATAAPVAAPVAVAPPHSEPPVSPGRRSAGGGRDRGPRSGDRGRGDRGRGGAESRGRDGGERGRGPRRPPMDDLQPGDFERAFVEDAPEQAPESEAAKLVREWCDHLFDLARLELALRTEENEQQIRVRFYGSDTGRLVERDGELLDALQVLANKALVGRKVEKEIEFDCGEFKQRRVEDLGNRAREIADRVRRDGREQLLPAMSPVERRIVHLALQDDAEVTTESRGDGFFKRVAIIRRPVQPDATAGEP
jgi:spoIIIJ-associated protein